METTDQLHKHEHKDDQLHLYFVQVCNLISFVFNLCYVISKYVTRTDFRRSSISTFHLEICNCIILILSPYQLIAVCKLLHVNINVHFL